MVVARLKQQKAALTTIMIAKVTYHVERLALYFVYYYCILA